MSTPVDFTREETYAQTRLPVSLASTLTPDAYSSAEFFELEKERLWAGSWICVGYTQQLPRVGSTFVTRVNGQSILVTRSAPDDIRAFYNVCRHRGAELLSGPGCHKFFRCPYHSWGYGLDGTLKGAPYFEAGEVCEEIRKIYDTSRAKEFDKADYGLLPVRVSTWGCLVFVNLDPRAASLDEQLGDLPARTRNYPLLELALMHSAEYRIEANWKLVAENYMEYYHLPTVHPGLNRVSHLKNHYPFQGPGMYYGMTTRPLDKDPHVPIDRALRHMPGLDDEEAESARWLWLFPNVSVSLLPDYMIVMLLAPDGPGRTLERYDYFFHARTMETPDFDAQAEAVYRFWHDVNTEDIVIVEAVQRGLGNRAYRGGRMCFRFEENIHRFQNHVIDAMVRARHVPASAHA